jgi:hypothetical protein
MRSFCPSKNDISKILAPFEARKAPESPKKGVLNNKIMGFCRGSCKSI